jgi:hypothetical protein
VYIKRQNRSCHYTCIHNEQNNQRHGFALNEFHRRHFCKTTELPCPNYFHCDTYKYICLYAIAYVPTYKVKETRQLSKSLMNLNLAKFQKKNDANQEVPEC